MRGHRACHKVEGGVGEGDMGGAHLSGMRSGLGPTDAQLLQRQVRGEGAIPPSLLFSGDPQSPSLPSTLPHLERRLDS